MQHIIDNIRARMNRLEITSVSGLAISAGLNESAVRDIFSGKSKTTTVRTIEALAKVLHCEPSDLLNKNLSRPPLDMKAVAVISIAEAEVFTDEPILPKKDWEWVAMPVDHRFIAIDQFGVRIKGTGSDKKYQDGNILVCSTMEELEEPLVDGRRYIVHRRVDGKTEVTVRQMHENDKGERFLISLSEDPLLQKTYSLDTKTENEVIEVYARVTGCWIKEE